MPQPYGLPLRQAQQTVRRGADIRKVYRARHLGITGELHGHNTESNIAVKLANCSITLPAIGLRGINPMVSLDPNALLGIVRLS